jgi:nucleoid-associated protein YgaU
VSPAPPVPTSPASSDPAPAAPPPAVPDPPAPAAPASAPPTTHTPDPAAAPQPGGLHRARLSCRETGETLDVHFNPTQVVVRKTVDTITPATPSAPHGAAPQFVNTHTRSFDFTLTLEAWSTRRDVVDAVTQIQGWMNPTQQSRDHQRPAPATIELEWWHDAQPLVGAITAAVATYSVFDTTGRPVRASVAITMHELPEEPAHTNPTSGTPAPGRTVLVREGDTLAGITYREYRDPSLWRGVALANGLTDPLALTPGRRLMLPMRAQLIGAGR